MSYLQGIHALAMTLSVALISPLSDAQAQSYPEKAVRLLVPFTAGVALTTSAESSASRCKNR